MSNIRLYRALHGNAKAGDYVVKRRSPRAWETVTAIAGWALIFVGVAATLAFAYTAVVLVFALNKMGMQ